MARTSQSRHGRPGEPAAPDHGSAALAVAPRVQRQPGADAERVGAAAGHQRPERLRQAVGRGHQPRERPEHDRPADDRAEPAGRRHHDEPRPHEVELLLHCQRPEVAEVSLPPSLPSDEQIREVAGMPRPGVAGQRHIRPDGQAEHEDEGRNEPQPATQVEPADRRPSVGHVRRSSRMRGDQEAAQPVEEVDPGAERHAELPGRQPVRPRHRDHRYRPQAVELRSVARRRRALSSHGRDRRATTAAGRRPSAARSPRRARPRRPNASAGSPTCAA